MAAPVAQFVIPDIFAQFPWPRRQSEYFTEVKAESDAWAESFRPFDEEGLKGLKRCDLALLGSLAFSTREKDPEYIRLGCDFMVLYYVVDEYTDVADGDEANRIREIVMDALRNPQKERPKGEHVAGAIFRDFWVRASNYVSPGADCLQHFIRDFDDYMAGVVTEAEVRTQGRHSSFQDYLKLRLYTIGCISTFVLCEFGLDLPEEALSHPRMTSLREQLAYITAIANDIYSYPLEKSRGGGLLLHNSVELVMVELNLDSVQDAINWLENYAADIHASILENVANMPSWGKEIDQKVKMYIDGIAQVARGIDDWCYEGCRYFGSMGLEIQKTRVMTINMFPADSAWQRLVTDTV